MHGLQEIIYINRDAARKARSRALKKRAENAQRVIAERLALSKGRVAQSATGNSQT